MSTEKTEAVVIRQADFSETSRVVTFFTRGWGKVTTVAKGGRRLKGPFESALDLLTVCRIVFIRKSSTSLDILTEAQLISRFRARKRDLAGLYGGYYVAELLAGLTEEYDPHPVLYDETVNILKRLSENRLTEEPAARPRSDEKKRPAREENPALVILRFELVVLREIGQLPAMDVCLSCETPLSHNGPFAFWVSQGGFLCRGCQKAEYLKHPVQPGTLAVLRRLAAPADPLLARLDVSPQQIAEMRPVTTAALSHILGRRPRTLRYLQPHSR